MADTPAAVAGLDFDPVELLETELKAADRARRLRAVRGLSAVATACGVEAAKARVLPVIEAHVSAGGEEDEVHLRIAEVLDFSFVTCLGGGDSAQLLLAGARSPLPGRGDDGARPSLRIVS